GRRVPMCGSRRLAIDPRRRSDHRHSGAGRRRDCRLAGLSTARGCRVRSAGPALRVRRPLEAGRSTPGGSRDSPGGEVALGTHQYARLYLQDAGSGSLSREECHRSDVAWGDLALYRPVHRRVPHGPAPVDDRVASGAGLRAGIDVLVLRARTRSGRSDRRASPRCARDGDSGRLCRGGRGARGGDRRQHWHDGSPSGARAAVFDLAEHGRSQIPARCRGQDDTEGCGMAIVDDRGRLLGRFNVVDVFVFILVVVMIPVAYAAYALFRAPAAKLTGVEPKQVTTSPNLRVRINGRNLRPFMRVSFNTVQGRTFMIGSTETAEVDLPDLEPGAYDVVLYDYAQEVDRLPGALTILPRVPAPTATLAVHGVFVGLTETQAASLAPGTKFAQNNRVSATVLAVGTRHAGAMQMRTGDTSVGISLPGVYDVPAALQLECFLESTGDGSVRC